MATGVNTERIALFDASLKDGAGRPLVRRLGWNIVTYDGRQGWEPVAADEEGIAGSGVGRRGLPVHAINVTEAPDGMITGRKIGGSIGEPRTTEG